MSRGFQENDDTGAFLGPNLRESTGRLVNAADWALHVRLAGELITAVESRITPQ